MFFYSNKSQLSAVEPLFGQYYARLSEFSARILNNRESAEDIVQEVFSNLCDKPQFLPQNWGSIPSFLNICVKNAYFNSLRFLSVDHHKAQISDNQAEEDAHLLTGVDQATFSLRLA